MFTCFDKAWQCAAAWARDHEYDYVLVHTGNPAMPYAVEEDRGQNNILARITSDPDVALVWTSPKRRRVPLEPRLPDVANDR